MKSAEIERTGFKEDRVLGIVFFTFFFLYIFLCIEPRLLYHGGGFASGFPVFFTDWTFFVATVCQPGGLIHYLSGFLFQFFHYSWAGTIIITAHAILFYLCARALLGAAGLNKALFVSFVFPVILLVPYSRYTHMLAVTSALLVSLTCVCLYLKIPPVRKRWILPVSLAMSVVVYLLTAGAFLEFALLCAVYEFFVRRRIFAGFVFLFNMVVVPWIAGVLLFDMVAFNAYSNLTSFAFNPLFLPFGVFSLTAPFHVLSLAMPVLVPISVILSSIFSSVGKSNRKSTGDRNPDRSGWLESRIFRYAVKFVLVLLPAAESVLIFFDWQKKGMIQIDYYAKTRNWSGVLSTGHRFGRHMNPVVAHHVNRALYHTGQLADNMFAEPQHPSALFLSIKNPAIGWHNYELFFELGWVGSSIHELSNSVDMFGPRPCLLKQLALGYMVNEYFSTAKVYLTASSKMLFQDRWAEEYLKKLRADPSLSGDAAIQEGRRFMLTTDPIESSGVKGLMALLKEHKNNKMAFEYLMAWHLLTGHFQRVAIEVSKNIDNFDYPDGYIPRHYQEAIVMYNDPRNKSPVKLENRKISKRTRERYMGFMDMLQEYYGGNLEKAYKDKSEDGLEARYGDTYWYYYLKHDTGLNR